MKPSAVRALATAPWSRQSRNARSFRPACRSQRSGWLAAKDPCLRALTFFRALVASGGPLEVPCAAEPVLHTQCHHGAACWSSGL